MNWKFWQKHKQEEKSSANGDAKLAKPRQLPQQIGMILVTRLNLDPDWVWSLKCVMRPLADYKNVVEFRVFNPETRAVQSVPIINFNSLDAHPELILFFGTLDKKTGKVLLDEKLEQVA
jgi:hypothetical protein